MLKKIFLYVCLVFTALFIFFYVEDFWNWDMSVPINFNGDTISDGGTLTLAKKAIRGDGILSTKSFWTIDDSSIAWGVVDSSVHYGLMRILALFIHSAGCLVNIYFMATFALCGCFMFYTLSRLNISSSIAFVIAIAYAFLPGHWQRNIQHLSIGSCFSLPLMTLGCAYIITDQMKNSVKLSFAVFGKKISINRNLIEGIIGALLVGFSSIYFCVFAMIVHTLSGFISFLNKKYKNLVYATILLSFDFVCAFFTVILPNIISNGNAMSQFENTRLVSDINIYSMKIAQLVLPIGGHRIPFLSKLRALYSTSFGETENASSSLGLIFSIGLILSIFYLLMDKKRNKTAKSISQIGKMNLLILLISMVGGVCELIGLVVGSIRCYNRMSFVVANFSAVVLGLFFEDKFKHKKIQWKYAGCVCLICISVFDQTNENMKISPHAESNKSAWSIEEKFFNELDNSNIKNILIYPSKYSSNYNADWFYKYELMKPYIHTNNIKFATGYSSGSNTDLWIKTLENYTDEEKLKLSAGIGFDGILLYKNGFNNEDDFEEIYTSFSSLLGNETIINSDDDQWYYFPLSSYIKSLEDWNQELLRNLCKKIRADRMAFDHEYMFGTSEIEPYLVNGFSGAETDLRWSLNDQSVMKFIVNDEAYGDIKVTLNFLYLYDGIQNIEIEVNDAVLITETLDKDEGSVVFKIPRELINEETVVLTINYSNAKSPMSLGISNDSRNLAVAWKNIKIEDTKENIMPAKNYVDMSYLKKYLGREY